MCKIRDLRKVFLFSNKFPFIRSLSPENPNTNIATWLGADGMKTSSGVRVSEDTAMAYSGVYAAVRIISTMLATTKPQVFKKNGKDIEIDLNHSSNYLISKHPNLKDTSFNFWERMIATVLLWGNSYAQIIREGDTITRLAYLHPADVEPQFNTSESRVFYKIKERKTLLSDWQIIHISGLGFDGLKGMSPIELHRNNIGNGLSEVQYQGEFYKNNASVSGVLRHPGKISEDAQKRLRASWDRTHNGNNNRHKSLILEEGMDFTPLTIKPADAQFIETRKFTLEEISRIYGVPLHMLNSLDKSSFNNIEHQSIEFVQMGLQPWAERIEAELDRKLLTEQEKKQNTHFIEFDLDRLLRGDIESRMNKYNTMFQTASITPNQIRQGEKMNGYDGGDEYFINQAYTKVNNIGNESQEGV